MQLRNKSPKRRVKAKLREDRSEPTHTNQVWAMDFVHDQFDLLPLNRTIQSWNFPIMIP